MTTPDLRPRIGMAATICHWSYRLGGTIIAVTEDSFVVQRDTARPAMLAMINEDDDYVFARDPDGPMTIFKRFRWPWQRHPIWTENGRMLGARVIIGTRMEYHDTGF